MLWAHLIEDSALAACHPGALGRREAEEKDGESEQGVADKTMELVPKRKKRHREQGHVEGARQLTAKTKVWVEVCQDLLVLSSALLPSPSHSPNFL